MNEEKKERRRLRRLHEFLSHHDIRYLGPISYQGFQSLGWSCVVLSVIEFILRIGLRIDPDLGDRIYSFYPDLSAIASLALSFLLIANFSRILNNNESYKSLLLRNGGTAFGIALISIGFFLHHVVGTLEYLLPDPEAVTTIITDLLSKHSKTGYIAFNLFMDLFLCTLTMFFLNARPKRIFTGKKVLILRFCAVLPVAYEAIFMVLKFEAANDRITLPLWTYPIMPVKPVMTFVLFLFLAIHVKAREHRFCKKGRSYEEYMEFQKTNQNSFHFAVLLAISMVITGLIDVALQWAVSSFQIGARGAMGDLDKELDVYMITHALGFGNTSAPMIIAAPLMLLYSFNRIPKRKILNVLVPAAAIILIVILLMEGAHYGIGEILEGLTADASGSGLLTDGLGSLENVLGGM